MIITAITIENFKGIKDPVRVELKPITLLFGPNSAGKSTIIQAIHYAREIFERGNSDPGRTLVGGESIDLGGFESLVYKHDKNRSIKLKFELDLRNKSLPNYVLGVDDPLIYGWDESELWNVESKVDSAVVEIAIKWSETLQRPIVYIYKIDINGEDLATIEKLDYGNSPFIAIINHKNSIFWKHYPSLTEKEEILGKLKKIQNDEHKIDIESLDNAILSYLENSLMFCFLVERADENSNGIPGINKPIYLRGQKEALPLWGSTLSVDPSLYKDFPNGEEGAFDQVLSSLIVGPGELVRNALRDFCYLGPLRKIPTRNHEVERFPDEARWANGLAAWDILYQADDKLIDKISIWLCDSKGFNTNYYVDVKRFRELETNDPLMKDLLEGGNSNNGAEFRKKILEIPIKRRLVIKDVVRNIELSPQDMGVGVSQVLPVLVAALYQKVGLVAIEQPELHIHPAWQVVLGDIFVEQISENPDLVFILETHSEHLLLRLLRRIRETTDGELPSGLTPLRTNQLCVNYIESPGDRVEIHRLEVTESGDSKGQWPKGFFEERAGELF